LAFFIREVHRRRVEPVDARDRSGLLYRHFYEIL
jgi:hypothetical protein